jgi:hypothetical protein
MATIRDPELHAGWQAARSLLKQTVSGDGGG